MKYDLDKLIKAKVHLDNFYLHLQMLEVHYANASCGLFPCTLDGRAYVWHHSLPTNSIQNWRGFKTLFLEKFADDKTPTMLLKELWNPKMGEKEKVKDFN